MIKIVEKLRAQRDQLKKSLKRCMEAGESAGGDCFNIECNLESGLGFEPNSALTIRKDMLSLKQELRELTRMEEENDSFEKSLERDQITPVPMPQRKRVPMIPLKRQHIL